MTQRVLQLNWMLAVFGALAAGCGAGQAGNSENAVENVETVIADCTGTYSDATDTGYQGGVEVVNATWDYRNQDCSALPNVENMVNGPLAKPDCEQTCNQEQKCNCLGYNQGVNDTLAALEQKCGDTSTGEPGTGNGSGDTRTGGSGTGSGDTRTGGSATGNGDGGSRSSGGGTGQTAQTCSSTYSTDYNDGLTVGKQFAHQAWKSCDEVTKYKEVIATVSSAPILITSDQSITPAIECRIQGMLDGLVSEGQAIASKC